MNKKLLMFNFLIVLVLFLTGCGNKTAITSNEFKNKAEGYSYAVTDATADFKDSTFIKEALIAQNSNDFQIEFYILEDNNYAASIFEKNKLTFESEKSITKANTKGKNYETYSLTTKDQYMYISKVDNTFIYVKEDIKNMEDIKTFIKSIGY